MGLLKNNCPESLDELARKYFAGDQKAVTSYARKLLESFILAEKNQDDENDEKPKGFACTAPDYDRDVISVVFFTKQRTAQGELIRFFLNDPYGNHMSGVSKFWEIFLAPNLDASLRTAVTSTRTPNPLSDAIPTALKSFKWDNLIPLGYSDTEKKKPQPWVVAQWSLIVLPLKRSTVVIKDEGTFPIGYSDALVKSLLHQAQTLKDYRLVWHVRTGECARGLVEDLDGAVSRSLDELPPEGSATALWEQLSQTVETTTANSLATPACSLEQPLSAADILQLNAIREIHDAYQSLVKTPEAIRPSSTSTYQNVPLERFGIVGLAGMITSPDNSDRVKLSGSNLVKNPMNQVLAAVAVDIHFVKFDPKADAPTQAERWRGFVGVAYTPEFGLIAGGGFGVLRNLSINVGMGEFRIDALKDGDSLGKPPADPADPFHEKYELAGFFALGFTF